MKGILSWLPVASGLLVLVLSLFVAVLTVAQRNSQGNLATKQNVSTRAAEETATLSLSPASGSYDFSAAASYPLGIILDSGGKSVDGVDVIINFDPKRVKVVARAVATTTLFEEFPQNMIDNSRGQIRFSGLTFSPKPVTGIIGTFTFQSVSAGQAEFSFDFSPGSTKDSNVAEHGTAKDILGRVESGSFSFK